MNNKAHNKIVSYIWGIADDVLRDVFVRGKYRDIILPFTVLRRLDVLLESSKEKVLESNQFLIENNIDDKSSLNKFSGYPFYNTSNFTMGQNCESDAKFKYVSLMSDPDRIDSNIEEYLDGFSPNVQEIISKFKIRNQLETMREAGISFALIEKLVSKEINLSPKAVINSKGDEMPALTNLGMGYVFEELIRKFNEENNEEAGEHFTPREVIELMTHLVFDPVKDQLPLTMTVYDPACGSGGMLTESQNFIEEKYPNDSRDVYLYGKEINDETYAICKSDMMIKGNNPENIREGSTLSTDEFAASRFDFMLSNPPYGKSWASEQKHIKDGSDVIDPRFKVSLKDYWGNLEVVDATPRSSDGQLLFLMEMVNKMKDPSVSTGAAASNHLRGSRIASVHNGSSLFTGDAGGGESNIRRFIIENDMLDAIVQLPNNLFYNTGITTYIWVLNNNKPEARKGKVQLIDASLLYRKLRKNLGNKNCEFAPEHITEITDTYLACVDVERALDANNDPIGIASKVFSNDDFGYYKVTIERPDRRRAKFTQDAIAPLRFDKQLSEVMEYVYAEHGERVYEKTGYGTEKKKSFLKSIEKDILSWCEDNDISLNAKAKAKLLDVKHWLALKALLETAQTLMADIGSIEFDDFNSFKTQVDKSLKAHAIKLSAPEKNAILNAVSWYDETAKKVVKKVVKLSGEKLNDLLERYECEVADLPDFGYYPVPTTEGGKKGEYITYETNSDLRDTESVPLRKDGEQQSIYQYFLDEVKPHVDEAWINLDTVKIGYEISFNKYFYLHKPLRSLEEVATDIINLEQKAEGLISQILGVKVAEVQGEA